MEDTNWDKYGVGKNPKCANCMAHCGFEPTAINDTFAHPIKAMRVSMNGPRTEGPMAADPSQQTSDTNSTSNAQNGFPIPVVVEQKAVKASSSGDISDKK